MYTKPQVIIDLDEYNDLKQQSFKPKSNEVVFDKESLSKVIGGLLQFNNLGIHDSHAIRDLERRTGISITLESNGQIYLKTVTN